VAAKHGGAGEHAVADVHGLERFPSTSTSSHDQEEYSALQGDNDALSSGSGRHIGARLGTTEEFNGNGYRGLSWQLNSINMAICIINLGISIFVPSGR
jgi:hypothetical protein